MNFTRKLFSILLTSAILFSGFVFKSSPAKAIKNFTVEVTPNVVRMNATYKFTFTIEKQHELFDFFIILFPSDVLVPEIPDLTNDENKNRVREMMENIEINGQAYFVCGAIPRISKLSDGSVELKIASIYQYIPGNTEHEMVEIILKPKFGIINPSKTGNYIFKVKTTKEPDFIESQPVEFIEKPDVPDIINANLWFSNPVKGQITNMLIHIPIEVNKLCCFEFKMDIPVDKLDMTVYLSKEALKKEGALDFIKDHTYFNGKTLKESTKISLMGLTEEGNRFYLQVTPIADEVREINILFDKALQIKFLEDGILSMNDSSIFVSSPEIKNNGKDVKLQFSDNYIFPEEKAPEPGTVAIVETFDATWLNRAFWNKPRVELNQELGPEKVAFITYYVDSTDDHPFPRLSCPESESRMRWYMTDKGIPTVFFNGIQRMKGTPLSEEPDKSKVVKDEYKKHIEEENAKIPPIKIVGKCSHVEKNTYKIQIEVQRLGAINFIDLQLVTALTESNIPFNAISSQKIHYFVFREFLKPNKIKDSIGIPINLAVAGGNFKTEFTFELNTELYKNDLNLIFFVQDMTQKNILQGLTIPFVK